MEIRQRDQDGATVIEVGGRFTVNDRPGALKDAVTGAVGRGQRRVLLDLGGLRYIDSTRIGELISAHVSVARAGGSLCLVRTPERIRELLEMVGLDGVFERSESIDAALRPTGH